MPTARKQSKSLNEPSQKTPTSSENEPSAASLNWLFFHPAKERTIPLPIDISLSFFRGRSKECRSLFTPFLLEEFQIEAEAQNIIFWKPKERLLEETVVVEGWAQEIGNVEDFCEQVLLLDSFAKVLDTSNEDAVHLIVTIENFHPSTVVTEHRESSHPMFDAYQAMVAAPGKAPSEAAKPDNYFEIQGVRNEALHDGRFPVYPLGSQQPVVTAAPPIQIYHPIFHKFLQYVNDPSVRPSHELLEATLSLIQKLLVVDGVEGLRNWDINGTLSRILGIQVLSQAIPDGSRSDGASFTYVNNIRIPIFAMELDQEMGAGECDPSTQVGFFMRRAWIDERRSFIRDKCCCPSFMIGGVGPWMGVLGSVMTDRFIVQRLTDLQWCGLSSTSEDARIYRFARTLNALRLCIRELQKYYTAIGAATDIKLPPHDPHPRYFPYPNSFTDEDNKVIRFEYLRPLQAGRSTCTTFLAKTAKKKIIVKFVSRYGADAHRFLANEGHAPRLHYHGPLPDTKAIPTTLKYPGLSLGPIQMVVMDYVTPCKTTPLDAKEQLGAILEKLHTEGYVFGDLRERNVVFDHEMKARLINFDWAGRFDRTINDDGTICDDLPPEPPHKQIKAEWESKDNNFSDPYVYYPMNILMEAMWAEGVEPLGPIRPSHDLEMLEMFGEESSTGVFYSTL